MSEYTDLRTLPDGTSFRVINGNWTGTVFSKNGKKFMHIDETDRECEITGNEELCVKTFVRMKTITIRVPEKATNGDVFKIMFPGIDKYKNMLLENHYRNILFDDKWWNVPYKQEDK